MSLQLVRSCEGRALYVAVSLFSLACPCRTARLRWRLQVGCTPISHMHEVRGNGPIHRSPPMHPLHRIAIHRFKCRSQPFGYTYVESKFVTISCTLSIRDSCLHEGALTSNAPLALSFAICPCSAFTGGASSSVKTSGFHRASSFFALGLARSFD